jgi:uncharacterized membrane protein
MSEENKGFLTKEETEQVIQAIITAESQTSGEIRVHIEQTNVADSMERALKVFYALKMEQTQHRNGVLFYVGMKDHSFVIIGDEGINQRVSADYWDTTKDLVIQHFQKGEMKTGLEQGILKVGRKLKELFPADGTNENELSNEISGIDEN